MEQFVLQGKIELDSSSAESTLNNVANDATSKFNSIGNTFSTVGSKLTSVGSSITKVVAGIGTAVAGAATGLYKIATSAAETTDNIDKMSQKLGLSRQAYQEWDYILSQNGASIDSMQTALKTMTNALDDATQKGTTSGTAFERLGLTYEDVKDKSPEEVFSLLITRLQGMEDATARTAIATDLFGRGATELAPLLNQTAESTEALRQKAHDLGLVLTDEAIDSGVKMTDTLDTLKRSFGAVGMQIAEVVLPYVQEFAEYLINHMPEIKELAKDVAEDLKTVLSFIADLIKKYSELPEAQQKAILGVGAVVAALGPVLTVVGNICKGISSMMGLFSKLGGVVSGIGEGFGTVFGGIGLIITGAITAVSNFVSMWQNGWDIIKTILEALGIALAAIGAVLLGAPAAVAAVVAAIVFAISQLAIVIHDNWDAIKAWTKDLFESIGNWFKEAGENVANFFKNIGEWAKEAFESVGEFFSNAVKKISDGFHNVVSSVTDMGSKVKAQFDKLGDNLHNASENIKSKLSTAWSSMKDNAVDTFKTMRENVASTMAGFKDQWVGEFVQAKDNIISTFVNMKSNVINEAKHLASSCNEAFSNIAEKAVSGFNKIKEDGMSALMSLKDNAFNAFKEVGEFISSKFQAIADGIGGIFKGVDEEVHKIIDKVMSFFDFDWKLPDIKLPHFSVGWKTDGWMAEAAQFLGLKGIPDINVEWYKDGGIMTQPTPFGYNAATGSVMAGGEAGPEAILPIDNLREYIRDEIDSSAMLGTMRDMLSIMQRYLPQQAQSLNNLNFKVNDREFARLVKAVD